ncbi:MAG: copper homeostasis protein CutC [Daejeonella sp.]
MKFHLEICAGSLRSAIAAQKGGADRIELCDNLSEGGTTPSYGMIKTCKSLLNIPVFPIIRPRGGDFVYTDEEFEVMKHDIICCQELGCEGVVFGILTKEGNVDNQRCAELLSLAHNMEVTFHRAFDSCNDFEKALEDLINIGCHRVLTSGGAMYAEEAISQLKQLIIQAGQRINIMPGSGVTEENLSKIAIETGAHEFHSTAKKQIFREPDNLGQNGIDANYLYETDASKVKNMMQVLSLME